LVVPGVAIAKQRLRREMTGPAGRAGDQHALVEQ
jgi:hypothetical protein